MTSSLREPGVYGGRLWIESRWEVGANFLHWSKPAPGVHTLSIPYNGCRDYFARGRVVGGFHGVDHPLHLEPRLKKGYSRASTDPPCLHFRS